MSAATLLAGLAAFASLLWSVFFLQTRTYEGLAVAVGVAGLMTALLRRRSIRTVADVPIALYAALAITSALVHRGPHAASTVADPTSPWRIAVDVIFFYGAVTLVSSRVALGAVMTSLVIGTSVIGLGAAYDSLVMSIHGEMRMYEYPTISQWNGWAIVGLVLSIGFPLALAPAIVSRRWSAATASAFLATVILASVWYIDSRGAYLAVAMTIVVLAVVEVAILRHGRLAVVLATGLVAIGLFAAARPTFAAQFANGVRVRVMSKFANPQADRRVGKSDTGGLDTGFGRLDIWRRAIASIGQHPWLGVGPGRYQDARSTHAHNMPLHIAAELGIPGSLAFLAIWWQLLGALRKLVTPSAIGVLAVGFGGALLAYFFRTLSDHFGSGIFVTSDRVRFLLWTLFAASAAIIRVYRDEAAC
ncbi:MAG TPA: O-antigen ligase family protein [Vicinamibacterales bacterium]|nr:O-antigen ligase family protein [Vicinamibacterales bacterium]